MKKLAISIICFVLTVSAYAESQKRDKLQEALSLSDNQIEPVNEILDAQKQKRKAIFEAHREQLEKDMDILHEETRSLLSSELNDEQMTQYENLRAERKAKKEAKRAERKAKREAENDNS